MSDKKNLQSMDDLPDGWVQQYDPKTDHPFWVDTKAQPPRAIWVHPYEDEQFLNEHPGIRERTARLRAGSEEPEESVAKSAKPTHGPDEAPPPYTPRRHSFSGSTTETRRRHDNARPRTPPASTSKKGKQKERGFFGKMKDKAIGTKEEREEARRREMIAAQRYAEQRKQQRLAYANSGDFYGTGSLQYGSSPYGASSSYGVPPGPFGPAMYRPPAGDPYYGRGYGNAYGNSYGGRYGGRSGFGGGSSGFGGIGLPLLGGLAGGLLLGDILDGGGLF